MRANRWFDVRMRERVRRLTVTSMSVMLIASLSPLPAMASTASDISSKTDEITRLSDEIDDATDKAGDIEASIEENASTIEETQQRLANLQERVDDVVKGTYKTGTNVITILASGDVSDIVSSLSRHQQASDSLSDAIEETESLEEDLQRQSDELLRQKDEQEQTIADLKEKKETLDDELASLKRQLTEEQSEANVKASQAVQKAEASSQTAQTFTTDTSTDGWKSGRASAYGGSSDPGTGMTTANGSKVTDWSMGVAIPLSWGRRDLLGHQVEISYNGKSVIATINDLGGMGGGSRALDLQPGVFKALGASTCQTWGVRTVQYRIL